MKGLSFAVGDFFTRNVYFCIFFIGKRGRLSKADLDTGWSKEDERQCSLCQKYGDLKPNVGKAITAWLFLIAIPITYSLCHSVGSWQAALPRPE